MKLAIVGKGGVGKTTISASLARYIADRNNSVIAVDADPDGNLPAALGADPETVPEPIAAWLDAIGVGSGPALLVMVAAIRQLSELADWQNALFTALIANGVVLIVAVLVQVV